VLARVLLLFEVHRLDVRRHVVVGGRAKVTELARKLLLLGAVALAAAIAELLLLLSAGRNS
jgi:hypothetical protein